MKLFCILITALISLPLSVRAQTDSVSLSEIMFYPLPGNENQNEYIEIYNFGSQPVDLSSWTIRDNNTLDTIVNAGYGTVIQPGQFGIVFVNNYDLINGQYSAIVPVSALIMKFGNNTIGNGLGLTDSIRLINATGDTVSRFRWSYSSFTNGYSLEKIIVGNHDNSQANWLKGLTANGSPGLINSVSPKNYDLSVSEADIVFSPAFPVPNQSFQVNVKIRNMGALTATGFDVHFHRIIGNDTVNYSNPPVSSLAPNDSVTVSASDTAYAPGQIFFVKIIWPSDQDSTNNSSSKQIVISGELYRIVINEIMYAPTDANNEWVEIYNRSQDTINLKNWKYADASIFSSPTVITAENHIMLPGDFILLCQDTVKFTAQYGTVPARKLRPVSWPALNNTGGDMVVILDSSGLISDSLFYSTTWGGSGGKSIERRRADSSSVSATNWATSAAMAGATPGVVNSVTPKDYDLSVSGEDIIFSPAFPSLNQPFQVSAKIRNRGSLTAPNFGVRFYRVVGNDTLNFADQPVASLLKDDSVTVSAADTAYALGQVFLVKIIWPSDQDTTNNSAVKTVVITGEPYRLVINEIMYAPSTGYSEWVEIYNRSHDTISLKNWKFADASKVLSPVTVTAEDHILLPDEFILLCADTALMINQYGILPSRLLRVSGWPSLNNDLDMVVLFDSNGAVVDSLFYSASWGGSTGGKSVERKNPDSLSYLSANWGTSVALTGATPGQINSLTGTPYDAGIASLGFIPAFPEKDEVFSVELTIKNYGTLPTDTVGLKVIRKTENDSVFLLQTFIYNLTDSIVVSVTDTAFHSGQEILAEIVYAKDQKPFNNIASKTLVFGAPRGSMVINEIMYSPLTGNAEWIEIVNRSEDTLDLRKWLIADEAAFTSNSFKTVATSNQAITPGEYVIICEDTAKFKIQYPSVTARKFRPSAWISLNESDMIVLTDSLKKIVDSVFYEKSWGGAGNKSLERKDINLSTTLPSNWGTSVALAGATPGDVNSLTPFDYDLAVDPDGFTFTPSFPQPGDTLLVKGIIRNAGLLTVPDPFTVKLYDDADFDGNGSEEEFIDSVRVDSLPSGQSLLYEYRYPLSAGRVFKRMVSKYFASADSVRFLLQAGYPGDQRPDNNVAAKTIRIGVKPQSVVINEILYYPDTNQVEFVELYNRSIDTINLKNWSIADASTSGAKTIASADLYLFPGHYRVITSDTTVYRKHPDIDAEKIIIVKSLAAFNNDKDAVVIKDPIGAVVDSFYYFSSWGGKKGVSLERIDVNRSSGDPGNWGSSIAVGGASPGAVNGILTAKPAFRNALVINEIMYAPFTGEPEYIELYNPTDSVLNLANWSLQVNDSKVILTTVSFEIPPGEYAVISDNRDMPARYKNVPRLMKLSSMPGLSNTGATVMIRDRVGTVIDSVAYDPDWGGQDGFSLERIKPADNGNVRTNWGSCMFVEGGTPGYLNSIYTGEDQPSKIKLSADPNPFFVDRNEQTKIIIELPVTQARLTLKIFDNQGRLIRTLLNNSYSGSYREVLWDGRDNSGHFARMGIYVMYLEAVNENPKFNKSAKKTVVLGRKL